MPMAGTLSGLDLLLQKLLGIEDVSAACRSWGRRPRDSPGPLPGCPHLGKHIWVGVVLQKHSRCPGVIVAGRYVQGGQAHLPFRPVVDEVCHYVLVALLQSHSQGSEAVLRGQGERWTCSGPI